MITDKSQFKIANLMPFKSHLIKIFVQSLNRISNAQKKQGLGYIICIGEKTKKLHHTLLFSLLFQCHAICVVLSS